MAWPSLQSCSPLFAGRGMFQAWKWNFEVGTGTLDLTVSMTTLRDKMALNPMDPSVLTDFVERKGSLSLRSNHVSYGRATLNSNW